MLALNIGKGVGDADGANGSFLAHADQALWQSGMSGLCVPRIQKDKMFCLGRLTIPLPFNHLVTSTTYRPISSHCIPNRVQWRRLNLLFLLCEPIQ